MIIGVTGTFGAGKTTVTRLIAKKGYRVFNADKIGHSVLNKERKKVIKEFGRGILTNNRMDRKKLGRIVFSDPKKLKKLNQIIHPRIKEEFLKNLKGQVVVDAALLVELEMDKCCDKVILVTCSKKTQIERLLKKIVYSKATIERVIKLQEKGLKHIKPDVVIDNTKSLAATRDQVARFLK